MFAYIRDGNTANRASAMMREERREREKKRRDELE